MPVRKNEEMTLFDLYEEFAHFRPIKSNDWKWSFSDYPAKNGLTCFSTFACGGGSTMGYKLCGVDVIGCLEIDKRVNDVYKLNHNPKLNYLMDIRDFNKIPNEELPKELFNLDILDGSPPCSTFSMAGQREKSWGVEKKFKEGQKLQTLDDLFFVWIETVNKLRPKVAIAENVEGLLLGNAQKYVVEIHKQLKAIGYKVKHYLLKGEYMGVPQTRHRVFFIAVREDIDYDFNKLDLNFNYEPIVYKDIKESKGKEVTVGTKTYELLKEVKNNEYDLSHANKRLYGKNGWFQSMIIDDDRVMDTVRAKMSDMFRRNTFERISWQDVRNSQTFPQDYNFNPNNDNQVGYICGMSVPPLMIKRLMTRLIESGLFDYKLKEQQ